MTDEQLEEGVDHETGLVDDPIGGIETHYARCEGIGTRRFGDDGYVSVYADYRDIILESRIAFDTLIRAGWTPPPPGPD